MAPAPTLKDFLTEHTTPEIGAVILGLSKTGPDTAAQLALSDGPSELDSAAGGMRFLSTPVGGITKIDADGGLAVTLEPLSPPEPGADTIPGMLFSIYPVAPGVPQASYLRPGTDQVAAGCILCGARMQLALTVGQGTHLFRRDINAGGFRLHMPDLTIPAGTAEFATNAAEYRHWEPPVQRFIDNCLAGTDGPGEQDFDMRWTGSLAAEVQRILMRGGIYLAPRGTSAPHPLVHHCHPVAMLIEQAGGQATDGQTRLLETVAGAMDTTSPLVFGSPGKVARVANLHDLPDSEGSPLFGQRGLFRI
jgi:fructose-1,6-bisphosphatase I